MLPGRKSPVPAESKPDCGAVCGSIQCTDCGRDCEPDCHTARIRDEFKSDPGIRRDVAAGEQSEKLKDIEAGQYYRGYPQTVPYTRFPHRPRPLGWSFPCPLTSAPPGTPQTPCRIPKAPRAKLALTQFNNPAGLLKLSGSLYQATDASGEPRLEATDTNLKASRIVAQYVEASNVRYPSPQESLKVYPPLSLTVKSWHY